MTEKDKHFQFIKKHEKDDIRVLALQAKRYPDIDLRFAVQQIAGRQIAIEKIPSWYENDKIIYPPHISLEQCSSEKTALYKASLCTGNSLTDLTGGLGVDFSFMSKRFEKSTYVERQEELVNIATNNFKVLGLENVSVINDNAETYLDKMSSVNTIYIDPSRRDASGRKTVKIEDCSPDLTEIEMTLDKKADNVIIKLSPMLDITLALRSLKLCYDVHIISLKNECKELLFIKNKDSQETNFHCININKEGIETFSFTHKLEDESNPHYTKEVHKYIYEPNASIIKAGAYKRVATEFNFHKLHKSSHLYTSDKLIEIFPGRVFLKKQVIPFGKKELKQFSAETDKANISTRNFPLSVDDIRKRTGIKDGGELYIFATTLADEKKILIVCEKIK